MEIRQKVVMFVGKGGVGKTTMSAATAMHFASLGEKTLIISTDPAPSLSDIFGKDVGDKKNQSEIDFCVAPKVRNTLGYDRETEITENLYAIELSFDEVLRRWKEKFGPEIYEVISSFFDVDYDIVDYIGGAPGIDEEFMLDYIHGVFREGRYDRIVWDTAPAGHTLRLLNFPAKFIGHLEEASSVYMKAFNYMERVKGLGSKKKKPVFEIIEGWKKLAEETAAFVKDDKTVGYVAVTIPEFLGVSQTKRTIEELKDFGINVRHLIINNVIKKPDCDFHKRRMKMQEKYIRELSGAAPEITQIPMSADEIQGVEKLRMIGGILFG